jgi:hypothetical protein
MFRLISLVLLLFFTFNARAGDWEIDGFRLNDKFANKEAQFKHCEITQTYHTFQGERIAKGGKDVKCSENDTTLFLMFDIDLNLMFLSKIFKFKTQPNYQSIYQQFINRFGEPDVKAKEVILDFSKVEVPKYVLLPKWTFTEHACWGHVCRYDSAEPDSGKEALFPRSGGRVDTLNKDKSLRSRYMDLKDGDYTHSISLVLKDNDAFNMIKIHGDKLRSEHQLSLTKDKVDF